MIMISMREFSRKLAEYVKRAKNGEKLVITKRNKPVIDIVPHDGNAIQPSWSTEHPTIKLNSKLSASELYLKSKEEERY